MNKAFCEVILPPSGYGVNCSNYAGIEQWQFLGVSSESY